MLSISLLRVLGRALFNTALVVLCAILAIHLIATVSLPMVRALGDGLHRADSTPEAIAVAVR